MDAPTAWQRATELVWLVRALLGPIPEDPEAVRRASPLPEEGVDSYPKRPS